MAWFDVYTHPDKPEHRHTPCMLDVQTYHLDELETRIVIALRDAQAHGTQLERIHPLFLIHERDVVLDTPTMATFPRGRLHSEQSVVQDALHTLFGVY